MGQADSRTQNRSSAVALRSPIEIFDLCSEYLTQSRQVFSRLSTRVQALRRPTMTGASAGTRTYPPFARRSRKRLYSSSASWNCDVPKLWPTSHANTCSVVHHFYCFTPRPSLSFPHRAGLRGKEVFAQTRNERCSGAARLICCLAARILVLVHRELRHQLLWLSSEDAALLDMLVIGRGGFTILFPPLATLRFR
jgi:hypothetical protein